ncbi:MAG: LptE family protein [Thermoanaerobaculia bacterium]
MRTAPSTLLLTLFGLGLSACGYGLIGRTSNLPADIQNIYVAPLQNQTTRSQVDLLLTRAIIDELVTRRRFDVVSGRDKSDAVLSGELTEFTVRPVTFDSEGRATEYEIQIRADMNFKRPDTGEMIWERAQYSFRESYEIEIDQVAYFDPEDETIEQVAEEFAETLVIDLLEGF